MLLAAAMVHKMHLVQTLAAEGSRSQPCAKRRKAAGGDGALERHNGAAGAPTPNTQCQRSRFRRPSARRQISCRRPPGGNDRDSECTRDTGQSGWLVICMLIGISSPPSGIRALLQRRVHRPASASSVTCCTTASEGRTDCPSSGPHWTDIFTAAAVRFRSCCAVLRC